MEKLFVPLDIALELKEIGFNGPCFAEYRQFDGNKPYLHIEGFSCFAEKFTVECSALLYPQIFNWFRDKHNLFININSAALYSTITISKIRKFKDGTFQLEELNTISIYESIFENNLILNKAIKETIKLIKTQIK